MIPVAEALSRVLALARVLPEETVDLRAASGRVLARDVVAGRTQPPFAASAMDGYAICANDWAPHATLRLIGEAAAGHGFTGTLKPGETVRIFTGAPLPKGADRVIIQEDVTVEGVNIRLNAPLDLNTHVRAAGGDFRQGDVLAAPRRLTPRDVALLAAMNVPAVPVVRRPQVAIIATGDELVAPGEVPAADQIIASNSFGIAAQVEAAGAIARILPIARDTTAALSQVFALAQGADLIVTIGGASVGDHDLVGAAAAGLGMEQAFYKVAMRPGKPLMAGRMGDAVMIGLPGNPVSSMVCTSIFILPLLAAMSGLPGTSAVRRSVPLAADLSANGNREHYMRARVEAGAVTVFNRQDSSLLGILAQANALVVRAPDAPAVAKGALVEVIDL